MRHRQLPVMLAAILLALAACDSGSNAGSSGQDYSSYETYPGFVDLYWDEQGGRLLIRIKNTGAQFLYQSSLPRGVGSNDLGLDRGQLGRTRLVSFERIGPKVLLVQHNLGYRARSDDASERQAVTESFATSVIWGFAIFAEDETGIVVDGTDFFLRDAHGVAETLAESGEGQFAVDAARSAIYRPRTRAFPDNTEVEAIVTFAGKATGEHLPTVSPDSGVVTVHMHHSFIRLPDDGYKPIAYDPRAGVIGFSYDGSGFADYASDIGDPLYVNFGRRHRLEKVDPTAPVSEAVEPIVYYLDPGAPEPVRSALLEGARWWNHAFEAAGYKDAFQVQMLPADADPMDVRYNVIQWVHRSTRGWSYGDSVVDPRTGEIIKGHVSLGSLRVRQDYLIVEGLLAPYRDASVPDTMLEVALARIRQLSAHEVGHTIGFEHNFAASTQDRASVMDYPFPLVRFAADGTLDFSKAYDDAIGAWDKRTVLYAYQDFADGVDADAARSAILEETIKLGYKYLNDSDSRALSAAHPDGNLWDNGADAIAEFQHLLQLRAYALAAMSERNIRIGRPLATIEESLVPVFLLHRFQIEAVGKLIGGVYYDYALRGDGQESMRTVAVDRQRAAIDALVGALHPGMLRLPPALQAGIPPRPPGFPKSRESFSGHTGVIFDPLAPAASAISLTLDVLLNPVRAARMSRGGTPDFAEVTDRLLALAWFENSGDEEIQALTADIVLRRLLQLCVDSSADASVRATALVAVNKVDAWLAGQTAAVVRARPHYALARMQIERMRADPASVAALAPVSVPPGSPIGASR
ncbi:MAG: zinc-dependent metalloprotease [Gammaproteobacteria bacterium]|nr:zinc-dependent metalloprotease [Gammaproteobacteria bacterium]